MRRLQIYHETIYSFTQPVVLGPHRLMLRPRVGHDIRIEKSSLTITPKAKIKWHRDELDNSVATATFLGQTNRLSVISEVTVSHYDEWPLDFIVEDHAVIYPFAYSHQEHAGLMPYLQFKPESETELFENWISRFNQTSGIQTYVLLNRISQTIGSEFAYRVREEPGVQSAAETLAKRSGSCRDFAWLFMHSARKLGLATRFVSGYLHAPATEMGYGATHAWAEVYLPGAGWKGFDPTSAQVTGVQHVAVAVSVYPESVPPIAGHFTGPANVGSSMTVRVRVTPLTT